LSCPLTDIVPQTATKKANISLPKNSTVLFWNLTDVDEFGLGVCVFIVASCEIETAIARSCNKPHQHLVMKLTPICA
jgi:hypothetical protein